MTSITTDVSEEHFGYYANGNLQSYIDPNGNETLFNYDAFGYVSEINYPLGNPSIFTNDEAGRIISKTENGVELNYAYDDFNQTTLISFPDGTEINYLYDFMRVAEIIDRGGRKSKFEYDGTNLIIKTVDPQGDVNYIRDTKGNVIRLVINGVTTSYLYDEMDRMVQMTNPDGTSKYYTYDELGNVITRLDENGTMTTYTYDYNLLTQIDYGDDTPDVEYAYNGNGEIEAVTDVNGITTYDYDNGGRLIYIDRPGSDGDMTYTYDAAGSRLTMSISDMNVGYEYDNMNRLTYVSNSFASASYQYDVNGKLLKKLYGNDSYSDYEYDNMNRLLSLKNKKSTGEIFSGFEYTYDDASMIKTILDNESNLYSYKYDYAYQLTEEKVEDAGGHIRWHDKFTYDNMGNRLTQNKNGIIDYYENNINNQLVSLKKQTNTVTGLIYGDTAVKVYVNNTLANLTYFGDTLVEFLAHDIPLQFTSDTGYLVAYANGILAEVDDSSRFVVQAKKYPNRVIYLTITDDTTGIPPENINMITRNYETIHYDYDPNGNLVERLTPFDTTTYTFDAENRLIKVELPGGYYEEYEYDEKWQRTRIVVNGSSEKEYVYDNPFEAVMININGEQQHFLRGMSLGGGIGGLIATNNEILTLTYNLYNHRGDVISNIDDSEFVIYSTDYTAFGDERNLNGENNHNFKYSTKEYDMHPDFLYFGNRYFSLECDRWISRDPIGFKGGLNLYGYTKNNPINSIDIDGTIIFTILVIKITSWVLLATVTTSIIAPYAIAAKCGKFQDDFIPELDIPGDEKPIPNYYRFPPPQQLRFK